MTLSFEGSRAPLELPERVGKKGAGGIDSDGMDLTFGPMAKGYLPYEVDQQLLLPPDMRSWLPEGHLAYFVLELVAHQWRSVTTF